MISIQKKKGGGWTVWMAADFVPLIAGLPGELRKLLENPDFSDQAVARLFPLAYLDDPQAEQEYQRLLRDDFLKRKREAIEAFEKTLAGRKEIETPLGFTVARLELAEEDLALWLGFFHDMRLVIATRLDISDESWEVEDDPDDPHAQEYLLLHRLGYCEEMMVKALREAEGL